MRSCVLYQYHALCRAGSLPPPLLVYCIAECPMPPQMAHQCLATGWPRCWKAQRIPLSHPSTSSQFLHRFDHGEMTTITGILFVTGSFLCDLLKSSSCMDVRSYRHTGNANVAPGRCDLPTGTPCLPSATRGHDAVGHDAVYCSAQLPREPGVAERDDDGNGQG